VTAVLQEKGTAPFAFSADKTTITVAGKRTLADVAQVLKKYPHVNIAVLARSTFAGAAALARVRARAKQVKQILKGLGIKNTITPEGQLKAEMEDIELFVPEAPNPHHCKAASPTFHLKKHTKHICVPDPALEKAKKAEVSAKKKHKEAKAKAEKTSKEVTAKAQKTKEEAKKENAEKTQKEAKLKSAEKALKEMKKKVE
jgi:hypothetical protein